MEIFHEYAQKEKESVWGPFLNLLNRQDGFITNMTARIIAKIACWSQTPMERSDLHFYLTWLKDQLKAQVGIRESQRGFCMASLCLPACICTYTSFAFHHDVTAQTNVQIHKLLSTNHLGKVGGGGFCPYVVEKLQRQQVTQFFLRMFVV